MTSSTEWRSIGSVDLRAMRDGGIIKGLMFPGLLFVATLDVISTSNVLGLAANDAQYMKRG
jgi:hypothetical protein